MTIYVDANGSYDALGAIEVAALLNGLRRRVPEKNPALAGVMRKPARAANILDLPIAGGEQDSSLPQVQVDDPPPRGRHRASRI